MRYSRQEIVLGAENQKSLQKSTVAIVGIGALGTVAAELLTRAGVKHLILIDRDVIEETNLQRQSLFAQNDIGKSKCYIAKKRLEKINPQIKIEFFPNHIDNTNIDILKNTNLILDGTDNLTTRFLIDDYCKKNKIPWIYAAAIKQSGYVMPILPQGPGLRDFLKPASLETCDTAGVLNTTTHAVATLQTQLAIQILTNNQPKTDLIHINLETLEIKKLKVTQKEEYKNYPYLNNKENNIIRFCATGKWQIKGDRVDLKKIKERWEKIGQVLDDEISLHFKNIILFKDGRALIDADSKEEAQSTYSKLVGN